ncbi:MAG: hypothetical protein ACRD1R_11195 [Acidobacteriota bacterium]
MRTRSSNPRKQAGFNLLDSLVTLAIVGVLSSLGIGYLGGMADQYRLQSGCQSLLSSIVTARAHSTAKCLPIEIRVHADNKRFALAAKGEEPDRWQSLPRGVEFVTVPPRLPTFHSRGNASPAGSFVIGNDRGQIRLIISPTGRVRWERL